MPKCVIDCPPSAKKKDKVLSLVKLPITKHGKSDQIFKIKAPKLYGWVKEKERREIVA